jgi:GTP-binding protein
VVKVGDVDFVLADSPGLIEGAHEGAGIDDRFLGHIERCRVLLHLVDVNEEDVAAAYRTVRREIRAYGAELEKKREVVALSKCDTVLPEEAEAKAEQLRKACRKKPFLLSAVSRQNVEPVLFRLAQLIRARTDEDGDELEEASDRMWQPEL